MIHHGIEAATFPEGDGNGGYLATLTRMSPDKGVHRAAQLARRAGVPLRIAAKVRTDQEQQYFDEMVRPLLGDGVEFVGEVDGDGKRELLTGAVALGLGHLMLSDHDGRWDRRDSLGLACGVLGLMCSGVALTMVGVVVVSVLIRRGPRLALAHGAPRRSCSRSGP